MSFDSSDSIETPVDVLDPLLIFPSEADVASHHQPKTLVRAVDALSLFAVDSPVPSAESVRPRRSELPAEKPALIPLTPGANRPGIASVRCLTRRAFANGLDEARGIVRSMRSNLARLAAEKTYWGF